MLPESVSVRIVIPYRSVTFCQSAKVSERNWSGCSSEQWCALRRHTIWNETGRRTQVSVSPVNLGNGATAAQAHVAKSEVTTVLDLPIGSTGWHRDLAHQSLVNAWAIILVAPWPGHPIYYVHNEKVVPEVHSWI